MRKRPRPPWIRERNRSRIRGGLYIAITMLLVALCVVTLIRLRENSVSAREAIAILPSAAAPTQPGSIKLAQRSNDEIRPGTECGIERWAIKTLMDSEAPSLPTSPTDSTIGALSAYVEPPNPEMLSTRVPPLETTLWRVHASLLGYRVEIDSDLHLVLTDPETGRTMIGEIPAPFCTNSPRAPLFKTARTSVQKIGHHVATNRWRWLDYHGAAPPSVVVEGYGFFDTRHGQTGMAANESRNYILC